MDALASLPATTAKKGPRAASTYRWARRNAARSSRQLHLWRDGDVTEAANVKAHLEARAVVANGACEAASKALIENNVRHAGLPHDVVAASAMLDYYCNLPGRMTRPQSRIIRALEKQVRGTGRK